MSWMRDVRAGNMEAALAKVTASPVGTPAEVNLAVSKSYIGQRWSHIKELQTGKVHL